MRSFLPTLRQLAYLDALAEHRHFGRAAEAMAVSQSTLSAGLKELESLLGVTLVERSRRGVHFTALGDDVAGRARALLRGADEIATLVQSRGAPLSGRLSLAVIPTIAPFVLPRLLPLLARERPALDLILREEPSAAACDALHRGTVDCALIALPYACGDAETLALFDDPLLIALPSDHPMAPLPEIDGSTLEPSRLLMLEDGHCLKDHALRQCGLNRAPIDRATMSGTSLHTLVQMVAGGLGATFVPQMAVAAGLIPAGVVARPLKARGNRMAARSIALAWRRGSPRAADFHLLGEAIRAASVHVA